MADKTFVDGAALVASDVNTYLGHTGGTWNTWTPVVTQTAAVSITVNEATYHRSGRLITVTASVTASSTGTGGTDVIITLPVATKSGYVTLVSVLGAGRIFDQSAGLAYPAYAVFASASTIKLVSTAGTGTLGTAVFTAALATSDTISLNLAYEAAAG